MKTVILSALSAACLALSLSAATAAPPKEHHENAPTTGTTAVAAGDHHGGTAHLSSAERYIIAHNAKHR